MMPKPTSPRPPSSCRYPAVPPYAGPPASMVVALRRTKRRTPCWVLARSMNSFRIGLLSRTSGATRNTAVMGGEILVVVVVKGFDHVVRSSQSNFTAGWPGMEVAGDEERLATR